MKLLYTILLSSLITTFIGCSEMEFYRQIEIQQNENFIYVNQGSKKLFSYKYSDTPYKPYVKELYTPSGLNVLRDSPADHPHHRGLMYAIQVDDVMFWGEVPDGGKELQQTISPVEINNQPGLTGKVDWLTPENKLYLKEERTIYAKHDKQYDATILTWQGALSCPDEKNSVTLSGDHYFGLGMRFINEMDENGKFINRDNNEMVIFRGLEKLVCSKWCIYIAKVDDNYVTVAMFDHPDNKRQPATFFTMATPFSYLSATMALHEKPFTLNKSSALELRYGIVVLDGKAEAEKIENIYQKWLAD